MKFRSFLNQNLVCLDGGMGTILQEMGLAPGQGSETWNLSHPDEIKAIHKAYFEAGSHVVCTNTFGANALKYDGEELEKIVKTAVLLADGARKESDSSQEKFVALDIGPTGKLLKPLGDLDFEDAVSIFAETIRLGVKYGVDLIFIETMNDSYETKAAVLAAKENSDLPILVSNAYGEDGTLMTGATPTAMVALLEGMGVDALGANCSFGPAGLRSVVEELLSAASIPVLFKPNAGLPQALDGKTVFDVTADEFSDEVADLVKKGVRVVGGCCGTTPDYIKPLCEKTKEIKPKPVKEKETTLISSYSHAVSFDGTDPILIGERINPTGKKRFRQALLENDFDYILTEGVNQEEKGVHVLDVNVGLPEIDEVSMLPRAVCELQAVTDLPLQIDTSNVAAMEEALRRYNGKAMINSVTGKAESMKQIFPLVKKYGGVVVALTLDDNGIPNTAEGRWNIAQTILKTAAEYGISKKNIIFDPLAMTISADHKGAIVTLSALKMIREQLSCHTVLGVSNVSFGLPTRDAINGTYFVLALENGLSAAIMNPFSQDMMKAYYAFRALKGLDENCSDYIAASSQFVTHTQSAVPMQEKSAKSSGSLLQLAIEKGLKEKAADLTSELLQKTEPLSIVNDEIIPALNTVGKNFEKKTVYLPQLLMSAEAAKAAFEIIKKSMADHQKQEKKGVVVIATVHGDIHDIGKNILKLLLENYGFDVVDLGKDVPPETVVEKVVELHAPLVGLSALMTTTVPAMEKTIWQLKISAPWCKTVVGGAVLTQQYADKIGADKYAKDAMEGVRYAQSLGLS